MKARYAELVAPRKFRIVEDEVEMNNDMVLVKILGCGICMSEMNVYRGALGEYPKRIGHEPFGIIEDVGSNVRNFSVEEKVTGWFSPAFASHAVVNPESLVKIPEELPLEYALGEPIQAVVTCCRACNYEFGDHVLLVGCGFMGLMTLCGIKGNGAVEIIAVDLNPYRLKIAKELGATITLNPNQVDIEREIRKVTNGRGVEIAIEATGKPKPIELVSKLLRPPRPKLVLIGYHDTPETYNLKYWVNGAIIHNPHPGYCRDRVEDSRRAMEAVKKGIFPLAKLITHRFKLEDITRAFEVAEKQEGGYIKGVICPAL